MFLTESTFNALDTHGQYGKASLLRTHCLQDGCNWVDRDFSLQESIGPARSMTSGCEPVGDRRWTAGDGPHYSLIW